MWVVVHPTVAPPVLNNNFVSVRSEIETPASDVIQHVYTMGEWWMKTLHGCYKFVNFLNISI